MGQARYPPLLSPSMRWPPGAAPGELIQQEHDFDLLARGAHA